MYEKLYALIDQSITDGVPPHLIADRLVKDGWPAGLVRQAMTTWLNAHGRSKKSTAFKDWIKKYHRQALPAVCVVVFINVFNVGINLLRPWPTKILADSGFGGYPAPGPLADYTGTSTLILITSAMTLTLFVLGAIFGAIRDFMLLKIGFWLNKSIKEESLRHIMHLPLFHQERLSKGDYVYRQNVVTNSLSDLVLGTTSSIIESIIVIIGVLAIMITLNAQLTIISIILIPFLFLSMRLIGPRLGRTAQELTEVSSESASRINESVDNAETVQAFTLEDKLLKRISWLWDRSYILSRRNLFWGEVLSSTNGLLIVLSTSAVMYLGGTAALKGELKLGELLVFMTYMGYLLDPVENLIKQITSRNQKIIDVNRIYEVLADHEGIENLRKNSPMPRSIKGEISFHNVSYSYNNNIIFKNLNFTVSAGQRVGIIGPSGSGKSTILKLMPLFIEPEAGRILIDGVDIQSVSLKELRKNISWVSQNPQLFEGSIIDNLLDGDSDRNISNEEIMYAIDTANVTEFAAKLPMGLASAAGENGSSLSGGQRQRISIARALVKNAPIVCLDEPTAALDAKSENLIRDSLLKMIEHKTVMMVTHRKALLALMDKVYVLSDGTLVDVQDLGGLDSYLSRLEGIEHERAMAEIQADINQGANELLSMYTEFMMETQDQPGTTVTYPSSAENEQIDTTIAANSQQSIPGITSIDTISSQLPTTMQPQITFETPTPPLAQITPTESIPNLNEAPQIIEVDLPVSNHLHTDTEQMTIVNYAATQDAPNQYKQPYSANDDPVVHDSPLQAEQSETLEQPFDPNSYIYEDLESTPTRAYIPVQTTIVRRDSQSVPGSLTPEQTPLQTPPTTPSSNQNEHIGALDEHTDVTVQLH